MRLRYYVFIILLNIFLTGIEADNSITVKQFPLINELPSNTVKRIFEDSEGYMWFGTLDGLCRYDGYKIITFRSNIDNPHYLTENEISYIEEDKNNNLWIGTNRGINILNKRNYQIIRLENEYVTEREIRCIRVMQDSSIWIAAGNDLLSFNPDLRLKKKFDHSFLPNASINYLYEDSNGNLWIGMWKHGLFKYDKASDSFRQYPPLGTDNNPFKIFQDDKKQFWICTWGDGLYLFDPDAKDPQKTYTEVEVLNKENHIKDQTFFSIAQDNKNKYIWVVSFFGIYAFEYTDEGKLRERNVSGMFKDFNKIFSEIIKDRNGNLWIGTYSEGVININFDKPNIRNIDLSPIKKWTGITPNITCIYKDKDGIIWFNQNRWGIGLYNPVNHEIKLRDELPISKYFANIGCVADFCSMPNEIWLSPQMSSTIYSLTKETKDIKLNYSINLSDLRKQPGDILKFHEDKNNNIWIVTSAGLFIKPCKGKVTPLFFNLDSITDLTEDNEGGIWISCANKGFFRLPAVEGFDKTAIVQYTTENSELKSNNITAMCIDANNLLWIGTKEGHIVLYDIASNKFQNTPESFKLIDEKILNILKDNYGHVWVSTNKRVVEYNTQNGASRDYSKADGISVNSFLQNSYYADKYGNIYFGGNGGISVFSSSSKLSERVKNATTVISDIKVNNQSLLQKPEGRKIDLLSNNITLNASDRNIEIDFSSLNYSFPGKIQYAYRMKGVDDNWVYTDSERQFAFYNQLPKGKLTLHVKATDENGLWGNCITVLEIYKKPAFYETWWAYMIYSCLAIILIYLSYKEAKRRLKLRNDLHIARIEKDKAEELAQTKLRYFTNVSHDFLTPLTIISCLIDDVETTVKGKFDQFDLMRTNISRLRRLLQQVLDFRKVESGNMKLKITGNDAIKFINDICFIHILPLMKKKDIGLTFEHNNDIIPAYFDADKLDKIIFNLLSNAYKYTPQGGSIKVSAETYTRGGHAFIKILVSDTGIGISPEDQKDIFTRFYTNKLSDASETNGIGLSLTKDLTELHHGFISVESSVNKGSTFSVDIPIDRGSYSSSEMDNSESVMIYDKVMDIASLDSQNLEEAKNNWPAENITLLIVEDNAELLSLMKHILSKRYEVETAANGIEALTLIENKDVDIIISDIMMPEMDGITLCKTLKNDIETSHIPIILLTARSSMDDRIECYNAGADGYISKPFELKLLEARINNFILNKKGKQNDFKSKYEINVSVLDTPSIDEQFLKRTIEIIEQKLSEPDFDVITLAKELSISKSSLYRKIKTLTDLSPSDFIRNIKLKHASHMLKDKSITIAEVAYAVGFSDPKYFSSCFKNEFNITPSDYQKQTD